MSVSLSSYFVAVPTCCCLVLLFLCVFLAPPHLRGWPLRRSRRMPPGPRGAPLLGSLLPWLHVRSNGHKMVPWLNEQARWGEMTTLHMGTKTWVLLNTSRVVNEIIIKRAALTHERPYFPVAGGLVSRDQRLFLQKTKDWREGRRLIHQLMTGQDSSRHNDVVEEESLRLLRAYLDDPGQWYYHNYRYSVSIMYNIVAGQPLDKSADQLAELQRTASTFLTSINSSLVEYFPQLMYLPKCLQFWRRHWEQLGHFHHTVFSAWWRGMDGVKGDDASPSFVRDSVLKTYSGTDEQAMYLTMLVINAGADNPRMALNAWVMSCLSSPDSIQMAREEIDLICGGSSGNSTERLPHLSDLPDMPYTCAVVKEVLRWRPPVPLMPQRVLVKDLEFEGYSFPTGTEFLANSYPICSADYDCPADFQPERWLLSQEDHRRTKGVEQDLWAYAFYGGRRVCVGYKLAQRELFTAFARLIYCFDIKPAGPFDDKQLNAFSPGEPFPVEVSIRSLSHEQLIRQIDLK